MNVMFKLCTKTVEEFFWGKGHFYHVLAQQILFHLHKIVILAALKLPYSFSQFLHWVVYIERVFDVIDVARIY